MKKVLKIVICVLIAISLILGVKYFIGKDLYHGLVCLCMTPIILVPSILDRLNIKISDFNKMFYLIFIFIASFLGSILRFYDIFSWFDLFAHLLSGMLISSIALEYLKYKKKDNDIIFNILFMIAITLMCASLWEFFEYFADMLLNGNAQHIETGVNDTMEDMLLGFSGSIIFCLFKRRLK